jgi:protein SCO1/2
VALLFAAAGKAQQQYPVTGTVLDVDHAGRTLVVSHDPISGLMGATAMRFNVRDGKELEGLVRGMNVAFSLVVDKEESYAERIQVRPYESVQQDPLTARRLKLLEAIASPSSSQNKELAIGQLVPDFTLTDHKQRRVTLSSLRGKAVAINFTYTSCALPDFCLRIVNNFGVLQKRFAKHLRRDLVLLTVSFDPARDTPEVLAHYASQWNANANWHFLTGPVDVVRRVSAMFGVDAFPDEGLMNHSLHTALIDRQGRLAANVEGNQFTAQQLGDLTETVLTGRALPVR